MPVVIGFWRVTKNCHIRHTSSHAQKTTRNAHQTTRNENAPSRAKNTPQREVSPDTYQEAPPRACPCDTSNYTKRKFCIIRGSGNRKTRIKIKGNAGFTVADAERSLCAFMLFRKNLYTQTRTILRIIHFFVLTFFEFFVILLFIIPIQTVR